MYLRFPVHSKSSLFGDNKSVVTSSTTPTSILAKRHHIASFHCVWEAIAAELLVFHWKDGKPNPVDILSKHYKYSTDLQLLKPILFWYGDTAQSKSQLMGSDIIPIKHSSSDPEGQGSNWKSATSSCRVDTLLGSFLGVLAILL